MRSRLPGKAYSQNARLPGLLSRPVLTSNAPNSQQSRSVRQPKSSVATHGGGGGDGGGRGGELMSGTLTLGGVGVMFQSQHQNSGETASSCAARSRRRGPASGLGLRRHSRRRLTRHTALREATASSSPASHRAGRTWAQVGAEVRRVRSLWRLCSMPPRTMLDLGAGAGARGERCERRGRASGCMRGRVERT